MAPASHKRHNGAGCSSSLFEKASFQQGCRVHGVGVPRSPGFGPEAESLIWRKLRLRALSVSLLWN